MPTRDSEYPDAMSVADLVKMFHERPVAFVEWEKIAVVFDREDAGLAPIEFAHFDPEQRLLVLELG